MSFVIFTEALCLRNLSRELLYSFRSILNVICMPWRSMWNWR